MQLRIEVFILEQHCFYQDADGKDSKSQHIMLNESGKLFAYARIVPAGLSFEELSIGRVITSSDVRGSGVGKVLMQTSMQKAREIYGNVPIRIGAQRYAKEFYKALGFRENDKEFIEDGIPHLEMLAPALKKSGD